MRKGLVIGFVLATVLGIAAQQRNDAFVRNLNVSGTTTLAGSVYSITDQRTIADNGTGAAATLTLAPTSSHVVLNCQDANGCTITMSETGAVDGQQVVIVNAGTGVSTFSDTSGVSELAGAFAMGTRDVLTLMYDNLRWVEQSRGIASTTDAALTQTLTNKTLDAEATGNVLTVPFTEWWPATIVDGGGSYSVGWNEHTAATDAPSDGTAGSTVNLYGILRFDDAATEYVNRLFLLPTDWVGAIDITILWQTSVTTGNVVWQAQAFCIADNESMDSASWTYNTAQTVTDAAKASASFQNRASITGLTTTGCAAGELLSLKIFRNPAHASDTLASDADLVGVLFTYRRAL